MVKIAISGGSGNVGQEVADALAATGRHEILILSRKDGPPNDTSLQNGVTWVKTDYSDPEQLSRVLHGVDTVLCFIVVHTDPGNLSQKALIDASVKAGVRRFAPSEWFSPRMDSMPWLDDGKLEIRDILKQLNQNQRVFEYCLFQPGMLVNYFTHPHKSAKHLLPIATPFDFNNRRALILEGSEHVPITLTTVQDLAGVVVKAVEYEGEWPVVGGIKGDDLTVEKVLAIGERVRGRPFDVERLSPRDLKAGILKSSWKPKIEHNAFTPEQAEALATTIVSGMVLGIGSRMMETSDEWNKLLPEFKFTGSEEFLKKEWRDRV